MCTHGGIEIPYTWDATYDINFQGDGSAWQPLVRRKKVTDSAVNYHMGVVVLLWYFWHEFHEEAA